MVWGSKKGKDARRHKYDSDGCKKNSLEGQEGFVVHMLIPDYVYQNYTSTVYSICVPVPVSDGGRSVSYWPPSAFRSGSRGLACNGT